MRTRSKILLMVIVWALGLGRIPAHAAQTTAPADLERLLASVPALPAARSVLWYGSAAALKSALGVTVQINSSADLSKLTEAQRYTYSRAFGTTLYFSPFLGVENGPAWQNAFGFDSFDVDRELTIGTAPDWFDLAEGRLDTAGIGKALIGLGYTATPQNALTLYTLGEDNVADMASAAGDLAGARYNRVLLGGARIVLAPTSKWTQGVLDAAAGKVPTLAVDPAYAAAARALVSANTPAGSLISAVILDGAYVHDTLLAGTSGALPRYSVAVCGYNRTANGAPLWTLALIYTDKTNAAAAAKLLPGLLSGYKSKAQARRALFSTWKASIPSVGAAADGKTYTVAIVLQAPVTTDIGLAGLVQSGDIGFLASQ